MSNRFRRGGFREKLGDTEAFEHKGRYREIISLIDELLREMRDILRRRRHCRRTDPGRFGANGGRRAQSLAQGSAEQAAAMQEIVATVGTLWIGREKLQGRPAV
jgi:hypothetical protein